MLDRHADEGNFPPTNFLCQLFKNTIQLSRESLEKDLERNLKGDTQSLSEYWTELTKLYFAPITFIAKSIKNKVNNTLK
jgi:hypothetical protein